MIQCAMKKAKKSDTGKCQLSLAMFFSLTAQYTQLQCRHAEQEKDWQTHDSCLDNC